MKIKIKNKFILIDDFNKEKFSKYNWSISGNYIRASNYYGEDIEFINGRCKKQKSLLLHRYLLDAKNKQIVDHINGDTLDNRLSNLRLTDHKGNARNRVGSKSKKNNLPKGVYLTGNPVKKYRVRLQTRNKRYEGGSFSCLKDAALKYNDLAKKIFGEFARFNS